MYNFKNGDNTCKLYMRHLGPWMKLVRVCIELTTPYLKLWKHHSKDYRRQKEIPPGLLTITRHHGVGEVSGLVEMIPAGLAELPKPSRTLRNCQQLMFQNP